ncbi:hypothetical protein M422DRAFT_72597 [Sphaerobolus stellatus SS14]|uniref:Unplaced genomic scaffold SPHSTscaffold_658, whole genome shotgun sequence n=1 Tax=Sphaerobolus stellatus (strain SS14) TaxID=990650 RepID=A0A0C9U2I7_SPHS4|nr:hypothetical protein M422DRAFT_72597 [Sphaerobolus stellatus SS14]
MISLLNLPEETITLILFVLDFEDIQQCKRVCRLFNTIISQSYSLQYKVELGIAGLLDGDPESDTYTVAARLEELKIVEYNWHHLQFRMQRSIPSLESTLYELVGGVAGFGGPENKLYVRGLTFIELPSAVRGTTERIWKHADLGINIRDFTMAPIYDLLVLVEVPRLTGPPSLNDYEVNIHLRSMATGKAHPGTSTPVISQITRLENGDSCGFFIRIIEDRLGLLYHSVMHDLDEEIEDQLYIWNWKTGELLCAFDPPKEQIRIDSFIFLSSRHFIVSRFRLDFNASFTPCFEIYDFCDAVEPGQPKLVRSYQLPALAENVLTYRMLLRSDPAPDNKGISALPHKRPFFLGPTSRLLNVEIVLIDEQREREHYYMLFVHISSLLDGLIDGEQLEEVLVPWKDWGPDSTRMINNEIHNNSVGWVCYIYGNRYVQVLPTMSIDGSFESQLVIYDFNRISLYRDLQNRAELNEVNSLSMIKIEPTVHIWPQFQEHIRTRLPYRIIHRCTPLPLTAVMIEEECILGLHQRTDSESNIVFLCI